ncbi:MULTISPECIES: HAD family hydrolase [Nitrosomonas]|uniref:CbbY n=1 Tax=Nitrosomonas communis TaxID=44574 RepID=A0A0F7K919_9PROT|nr:MULTISPECIES: HAD family hydrolase [Nitrosomonas]AKH36725.1 CbbY [Nitrosomonas communis]TYP70496.1 HAD superfamily hydrolase (TIGR01509 family) [Nitrosomonas communis]UVS61787.1 HAD family hydrolase [Nitrosomonas sp. PLL12]
MKKNNIPLSAVLFDVDGTLAETERDGHRPAFNAAFKEFELDWHWDTELYGKLLKITGGKERIRYYIEKYAPDILSKRDLSNWIAELHKTKTKYFVDLLAKGNIPLRSGIARLIHELRENEIKIGIATTTTLENVTSLLKYTLGEESISWFDVIGAGDIVAQKKPAPDIYYWTLKELGLPPQQCIAIEDSENGLQSSYAAGIKTIITISEYTYSQNFNGAAMVLTDLGEPGKLPSIISGDIANLNNRWIDVSTLMTLLAPNDRQTL